MAREFLSKTNKKTPAGNEWFYELAALHSFEKKYYFRRWLLVGKCVRAATSAICRTLSASREAQCDLEAKRQSVADNDSEI
jgi:hypothetical protein